MIHIKKMFNGTLLTMTLFVLIPVMGYVIDGIVTGRFLGTDNTAAYGMAAPVMLLVSVFGALISTGAISFLSQYRTKGENELFNQTFSMIIIEAIIFALMSIIAIIMFDDVIATLLGATGDAEYLKPLVKMFIFGSLPGIPLLIFDEILNQVIQLDGNKKLSIIGIIMMLITNILFDFVNVLFFNYGLFGMALATSISYFAMFIVLLTHFLGKKNKIRFTIYNLPWKTTGEILTVGLPNACSRFVSAIRTICLNNIFVVAGTSLAVAGMSVGANVNHIMMAVCNGATGVCVMMGGIFIADSDKKSLSNLLKYATKVTFIITLLICAAIFILSDNIAEFFLSQNSEALDITSYILKFWSLYVPFCAIATVYYGYLQGIRKIFISTVISMLTNGGLIAVCAFPLSIIFGINGALFAFPISGILIIVSIIIIVSIYNKHIPNMVNDIALLDNLFMKNNKDTIIKYVYDKSEIIELSESIGNICINKNYCKNTANKISLCIEELMFNFFNYGLGELTKPCIRLSITFNHKSITLVFRDNGVPFNPCDYYKEYCSYNFFKNNSFADKIGIYLVVSLARSIKYTSVIKLNNIVINM